MAQDTPVEKRSGSLDSEDFGDVNIRLGFCSHLFHDKEDVLEDGIAGDASCNSEKDKRQTRSYVGLHVS